MDVGVERPAQLPGLPEADEESRSRRPRAAATTGGSRRMQDGSCPRVSGGVWSSEGPQPPEL